MNTDDPVLLLHVSTSPDDLARALGSARTLHDVHPHRTVRIIVNGPALDGLVVPGADVDADPGTTVEACAHGVTLRGISADELPATVTTVPAAVVALADAQTAGAAYIRV